MKKLALILNSANRPSWAIKAMCNQLGDWINANKDTFFKGLDIVIIPDSGTTETKLYWLSDKTPESQAELDKCRDTLEPVLCAVLKLTCADEDPKLKEAMEQLHELRELKEHKKIKKIDPEKNFIKPLNKFSGFKPKNRIIT